MTATRESFHGPLTEAAERDLLDALLASVRRAVPEGMQADDTLAIRAGELGLHDLGALDPGWPSGSMVLYARALAELARHHGALARLVAASNVAPEVPREAPGMTSRRKAIVDALAVLAGRLAAGMELATTFARERVLFRRPILEVPAVQEALGRAREAVAGLDAAMVGLACAAEGSADLGRWAVHAGRALEATSAMVQLMGGTGLMEESGMPALYRDVLSVLAELPADLEPCPPEGPLCDFFLAAPGPGGVPLDPEGEPG